RAVEAGQVAAGDREVEDAGTDWRHGADARGGAGDAEVGGVDAGDGLAEGGAEDQRVGVGRAGCGTEKEERLQRGRGVVHTKGLVDGWISGRQGVARRVGDVLSGGEVAADRAVEVGQVAAAERDVVHAGADQSHAAHARGRPGHVEVGAVYAGDGLAEAG